MAASSLPPSRARMAASPAARIARIWWTAVSIPPGECSWSMMSASKPAWPRTSAASGLPRKSQAPRQRAPASRRSRKRWRPMDFLVAVGRGRGPRGLAPAVEVPVDSRRETVRIAALQRLQHLEVVVVAVAHGLARIPEPAAPRHAALAQVADLLGEHRIAGHG